MSNYDFKLLSSYDFEILVRDLLQEELKITLESFKSGRDNGIDFRYSRNRKNNLIVQCKHFVSSTFSTLISHLRKELPKVKKLKPLRYIIATSLGLTPANKEQILDLFYPYCTSTTDILGKDDLNNLLRKYPDIEIRNFKLWLTSSAVLNASIYSDVYNLSQIELDNIKDKLKFYVQNASYSHAKKILNEHNYCIIAGIPGIGKTTLAEILLFEFLTNGYQIIKVSNSIREAFAIYNSTKKQVFYYDDFLGATSLEHKMNKNEDQELLTFIERVKRPKNKNTKFILTTREYILNQAKMVYEKLFNSDFDYKKCIIDLKSYTKFDKAKILFNYIYFSNMPKEYKKELLKDKNYLRIINHKNYNPRIISLITNQSSISLTEEGYLKVFLKNLDNPVLIWKHAFENQLSLAAKNLLLVLLTLPHKCQLTDLRKAFDSLNMYRYKQYQTPIGPYDFKKALKELEGNFITISKLGEEHIISFANPSVQDFLKNYIKENPEEIKEICLSSTFLNQPIILWDKIDNKEIFIKYKKEYISSIEKNLSSICSGIFSTQSYEIRLSWLIGIADQIDDHDFENLISNLIKETLYRVKVGSVDKTDLIVLARNLKKANFKYGTSEEGFIKAVKNIFLSDLFNVYDYSYLKDFVDIFPNALSENEFILVRNQFLNNIEDEIDYIYSNEQDVDTIEHFISTMNEVANFLEINLGNKLYYLESIIENLRESDELDEGDWKYETKHEQDDDEIDSLFELLAE